MRTLLLLASALIAAPAFAQRSMPQPLPIVDAVPAAKDTPFPGTLRLHVDTTDTLHGVFKVEETIPVPPEFAGKKMALLFPKWLPGKHAPRGEIEKLAGLEIRANGQVLAWKRDPIDVFAFWVDVPAGATALDVRFQFLSATDGPQGRIVVTQDMMNLQPNSVSLYPAGWFTRHYDLLLSLTEKMGGIGLEHHRSSENGVDTGYFTDWDRGPGRRNLLPHEFTHSWNGKHRRGADLVTPDFRTPMRNSMLWVYVGQTQFWGYVLQARSGLVKVEDTLDQLATIAATLDNRPARSWRSLDDTTNDPIITPRAPKGWLSFQRSEDYYTEGLLIWLEADAIIRRESNGTRSLDDFARRFFGTGEGDWGVKPYDFAALVAELNAVQRYDWAGHLQRRLTEKADGAPLKGLELAGWKLVYTDKPSAAFTDANRRQVNLLFSGGLLLGLAGKVDQVLWNSAAYAAGLAVGDVLLAVNELPFSDDALRAAVTAAKGGSAPIRLMVKTDDRVRTVDWAWAGGLRYPRLERIGAVKQTPLEMLLAAKK